MIDCGDLKRNMRTTHVEQTQNLSSLSLLFTKPNMQIIRAHTWGHGMFILIIILSKNFESFMLCTRDKNKWKLIKNHLSKTDLRIPFLAERLKFVSRSLRFHPPS